MTADILTAAILFIACFSAGFTVAAATVRWWG